METLATLYAYQTGYIPAPPQVAPGHPKLVDGRTPSVPGITLKSSIGMGGYNTVVVIGEPDHPEPRMMARQVGPGSRRRVNGHVAHPVRNHSPYLKPDQNMPIQGSMAKDEQLW